MCLIYNCHNFISVINNNYRFKLIDFFLSGTHDIHALILGRAITGLQAFTSDWMNYKEWSVDFIVSVIYIKKKKKKSTAEKLQVFEILFLSSKINKPIIYDSGKSEMDKTGIYLLIFF